MTGRNISSDSIIKAGSIVPHGNKGHPVMTFVLETAGNNSTAADADRRSV
jgi:hypothetical protein